MIRIAELKLPLAEVPAEQRRAADAPTETEHDREPPPHPLEALTCQAAVCLGVPRDSIVSLQVFKRSFDARKADLLAVYIVDVVLADLALERAALARHENNPHVLPTPDMTWRAPGHAPAGWPAADADRPVVVGLGPCGLFTALALAQMGLRPIVLERGKAVRERTKDTWGLWRRKLLNPQSNVQYGEGGAGLFSDGKLYSQIKDPRFLGRKVMHEFVEAGAPPEILYQAHPHIGTFKLVRVVEAMREKIVQLGGEIRFQHQVVGMRLEAGAGGHQRLGGLRVQRLDTGETVEMPARHAVFALGHSARDTFAVLHDAGVLLEAKPFSVGFRIEHPQGVIDRARWGRHAGHPLLGAADYKLVHHAKNGRAVYSFCMCPGGTVVAATSEPGRVVTNGMSQYSRNERNANAGLVVGIDLADYPTAFPQDLPLWMAAFRRSRRYALRPGGRGDDRRGTDPSAGRHRAAASARSAGLRAGRRQLRGAGPEVWATSWQARSIHRLRRGAALVQAGRQPRRPRARPAGLCDRRHARGAAGVRPQDQGLRHGRRHADRRRDPHQLAAAHHPGRRLPEPEHAEASTPPAKARATQAASSRPGWTASRWPKRSARPSSASEHRRLHLGRQLYSGSGSA